MRTRDGIVAATLLLVACGSGGAETPEACTDPVPADTVELADFEFRPGCLEAEAGASIKVENTGEAPHTFTVEGTDVDLVLAAGSSTEVGIAGVDPGRYAVTCTYHPQMTAILTVA